MMVVTEKERKFEIRFRRIAENGVRGLQCLVEEKTLSKKPKSALQGEGKSYCSPSDRWDPVRGKKLALGRAMKDAGLNKAARQDLWQTFLEQWSLPQEADAIGSTSYIWPDGPQKRSKRLALRRAAGTSIVDSHPEVLALPAGSLSRLHTRSSL